MEEASERERVSRDKWDGSGNWMKGVLDNKWDKQI
jgi:hypothetical protein